MTRSFELDKLRSFSQIFSTANFRRIVKNKDYSTVLYSIEKYSNYKKDTVNIDILNDAYNTLLKNYRSEYIYKNILINKLLLKKYSLKNSISLDEFRIGNSVADFILLNGEARVYEIKTELDTLEKLPKQLEDYFKFADKVYIVSSSAHLPALLKKYNESIVGIIELTNRNALRIVKEAQKDTSLLNHETLFKTLRKKEYISLLSEYFGKLPSVPNTRIFRVCLELAKTIEVDHFQTLVVKKLKERKLKHPEMLVDKSLPESLKHICYNLDLSSKDYKELNSFLHKKVNQCISHT